MKTHVITAELRRRFAAQTILSVVGLRRDESRSRAATPVSKLQAAVSQSRSAARLINWHPIAAWSEAQVYAWHAEHAVCLHEAYTRWQATRMGCTFCVLASLHNLATSAAAPSNTDTFRVLVDLEIASQFSFQPARWLADVAPNLLTARQHHALAAAKINAARRRQLEASLPAGLRFQRGWPPRVPTLAEAGHIAAVRTEIIGQHGLANHYPTARAITARFAELFAVRADPGTNRLPRSALVA